MINESGRRRPREIDEEDEDRDRIRRRLNDDEDDDEEDDEDGVYIPLTGNRRTIEQAGLPNRDRERRLRNQEPTTELVEGLVVNNPAAQAHLRQLFREGLANAHLNEQQMRIAEELMVYSIEWKIHHDDPDSGREPPRPPMLLIHGGPGTGKTHLMRSLNNVLKDTLQTSGILNAAYTGVAASLLSGGQTLNKLLDIKLNLGTDEPLPPLSGVKRAEMQRRLKEFTALLIDEVSMLSPTLLRRVDERLREVKCSDQAFGGMLVILQGDMFQLPPVRTTSLYKAVLKRHRLLDPPRRRASARPRQSRDDLTENERAGARLFERFELRTLNIQERASTDRPQIGMINQMRDPRMNVPRITQQDLRRFKVLTATEAKTPNWRFAPVLVCDNETRAVINEEQMCNFGREHGLPVIGWIDIVRFRYADEVATTNTNNATRQQQQPAQQHQQPRRPTIVLSAEEKARVLDDNMHHLASYFVPGAPAYLTENINPTINLANGTDVVMHSLGFQFENQEEQNVFLHQLRMARPGDIVMLPRQPSYMNVIVPSARVEEWPDELRLQAINNAEDDNAVIVPIGKEKKGDTITLLRAPRIGVSNKATVKPLALSEAMSITYHKSQGKTLPYAVLDLRAEGLDYEKVYVGMTRTPHSDNTRIINLSPSNILNLRHLLDLQPPRELLMWLAGFDQETNRWDSKLVSDHLADEDLRNHGIDTTGNNSSRARRQQQSNASNSSNRATRGNAAATEAAPPQPRAVAPRPPTMDPPQPTSAANHGNGNNAAVRDNTQGADSRRPAAARGGASSSVLPVAAAASSSSRQQQQLPAVQQQQPPRIPTYAQPNNNRGGAVSNFSALFMPIIAVASTHLPQQNSSVWHQHQQIRQLCGLQDFHTLCLAYRQDFRQRGVDPFGNGGYRYLNQDIQEWLLFPAAEEVDEHGNTYRVGLLGDRSAVGESLIPPYGEVAMTLSRVCTLYNEAVMQEQHQQNQRRR